MDSQNIEKISFETRACGNMNIYLQGSRTGKDVAAITMHDLGCNHHEFYDFVNHDHMSQLAHRCFWVHAEVPGQGDHEADLEKSDRFPTMQQLAEGLSEICDSLQFKHIVLLGDGAGANILTRLAILRNDITIGAFLIHCTGTTAGFLEYLRDKLANWKLKSSGLNSSVESYLLLHRFGLFQAARTELELNEAIKKFRISLREFINSRNLDKFIQAFIERTNITDSIGKLTCPVLFLTGSLSSLNQKVYKLYNALQGTLKFQPSRRADVEILEVDGVANVMLERPEKVAECLQNFLQGLGIASGAVNRRINNTRLPKMRARSESMDHYDRPVGVKNLIYDRMRKYTIADMESTICENEDDP